MPDQHNWLDFGALTAPHHHAHRLAELPQDFHAIAAVIQGLLVHADWAAAYGLAGVQARHTLSVAERLDDVLWLDPASLVTARPPPLRSTGSCRDFALLLCSILRLKSVPARVRCGFAAYFDPTWEDHWLCEYWDAATETWQLADAQIDPMLRQRQHIEFDAMDIPRSQFLTAGEAWLACRNGADPAAFGHGSVIGLWFVGINVVRDHFSMGGKEASDWDRWREVPESERVVSNEDLSLLDDLAREPELQNRRLPGLLSGVGIGIVDAYAKMEKD